MTSMLASAQADPFGLRMAGENSLAASPGNEYLYNGKELQVVDPIKGTNSGWGGMMAFTLSDRRRGARMYAPDEGRWKGVDALSELYGNYGAYIYVLNSPTNLTDPDGLSVTGQREKEPEQIPSQTNLFFDMLGGPKEVFHTITGEKIYDDHCNDGEVWIGTDAKGSDWRYVGQREFIPDKTLDAYYEILKLKSLALQMRFGIQTSVLLGPRLTSSSMFDFYAKYKTVQILTWKEAVTDGAPFDSKNNPLSLLYRRNFTLGYGFFENRLLKFDDFGNMAFGAAAKAYGMSLTFNLFGGGMNQLYKGYEGAQTKMSPYGRFEEKVPPRYRSFGMTVLLSRMCFSGGRSTFLTEQPVTSEGVLPDLTTNGRKGLFTIFKPCDILICARYEVSGVTYTPFTASIFMEIRRTDHPLGGISTFFDTEKDAFWVRYGYNNF